MLYLVIFTSSLLIGTGKEFLYIYPLPRSDMVPSTVARTSRLTLNPADSFDGEVILAKSFPKGHSPGFGRIPGIWKIFVMRFPLLLITKAGD